MSRRAFVSRSLLALGWFAASARALPTNAQTAIPASTTPATIAPTLGALLHEHGLPPPPISLAELGEPLTGYAFARDPAALTLGYSSDANVPHVGVVRYDFKARHLRYVSVPQSNATSVRFRRTSTAQQCATAVDGAVTYGAATYVLTQQTPDAGCVFAFTAQLKPVAIFSGFPIGFAARRYVLVRESQIHFGFSQPQLALSVYDATTNTEEPVYPVPGDRHLRGYDLDGEAVASPSAAVFAVTADPNGNRQVLGKRPPVDYLFVMVGGRWRSRAIQSDRLAGAYGVSTLEALVRLPIAKLTAGLDPLADAAF